MPVLLDSSSITSLVHCADVSLTEPPASRPNGRRAHRHARECESNTGSNHHRQLQRSRCPNDNMNKSLVKQLALPPVSRSVQRFRPVA